VRAFIGFFTTRRVQEAAERIRREATPKLNGKWVEPHNLHLTFQFLGEVSRPQLIDVIKALQEVARSFAPFTITYKGLGVFPDARKARVLWMGVSKGANRLKALAKEIERKNARYGIKPSSKAFVPHVTLCRLKSYDRKTLNHLMTKYRSVEFAEEEVNKLALVSSTLTAVGPVYSIVEEFYLEG